MSDILWYAHIQGNQYGPVKHEQFRDWIREGRIKPDSPVWHPGIPKWRTAKEMEELEDLFEGPATLESPEFAPEHTKALPNEEIEPSDADPEGDYEKTVVAPSPFLAQMLRQDLAKDDEEALSIEAVIEAHSPSILMDEIDDETRGIENTSTEPEVSPIEETQTDTELAVEKSEIHTHISQSADTKEVIEIQNPFSNLESERDTEHEVENETDETDDSTRVMEPNEILGTLEHEETVTQHDSENPFSTEQDTLLESSNETPEVDSSPDGVAGLTIPDSPMMDASSQEGDVAPLDETLTPPSEQNTLPTPPLKRPPTSDGKSIFIAAGILGIVVSSLYIVCSIIMLANDEIIDAPLRNASPGFALATMVSGGLILGFSIPTLLRNPRLTMVYGIFGSTWALLGLMAMITRSDILLLSQGVAFCFGGLAQSEPLFHSFGYLMPTLLIAGSGLALFGLKQIKDAKSSK